LATNEPTTNNSISNSLELSIDESRSARNNHHLVKDKKDVYHRFVIALSNPHL
jgi:hypothetical protein